MPRKQIYLIKAAQAKPFFETASRLGAPVRAMARHAGMPIKAVRSGEGVIGEHSLWRFVELAAQHLGNDHFGYLTAVSSTAGRVVPASPAGSRCARPHGLQGKRLAASVPGNSLEPSGAMDCISSPSIIFTKLAISRLWSKMSWLEISRPSGQNCGSAYR